MSDMPTTQPFLNEAQRIALSAYADGEAAYLLDIENEEEFRDHLDSYGDGLLKFIVLELKDVHDGDASPADNLEASQSNLERAMGEMQDVIDAIASRLQTVQNLTQRQSP